MKDQGIATKEELAQKVPTEKLTLVSLRHEPSAVARGMDVDTVHSTLRSAESGDVRNLMCLYREVILSDSHLQTEFAKRKLAVLGDAMSFHPYDKKSADDQASADFIESTVSNCSSWITACAHLLDSVLYPLSLVEKVYAPVSSLPAAGAPRFAVKELVPVPHHLLDFTSGRLKVYDVEPRTGQIMSTSHDPDPSRYIIHRAHLLSTPDNWGGPMRSVLFWWLLSTMDREWWARFLDRYGSPFLVGTYDRGDDESRTVLQQAFSLATKIGGLVITRGTEIEIQQAAASNTGEAYEKFLTICQREKSKAVLGGTLSAEAQATGLGSGVSEQQETVRDDIRKFDAARLADTLKQHLFRQMLHINNHRGAVPGVVWGSDSQSEIRATVELLKSLKDADLDLTDDAIAVLSERLGLSLQRKQSGGGYQSPLPFAAREVGNTYPFSADSLLPPVRRTR